MADYLAMPPARGLAGTLRVPSSKSATNRALLAAALAGEPVEIRGPLVSDDTVALRRCLESMGASVSPTARGGSLRLRGPLAGDARAVVRLDVHDSGTAARFLAAAAAAVPGHFELDGSARLRERPIGELVDALRGVMLQGAGWRAAAGELAIIAAWFAVCFPLAVRFFRWR